MYFIPYRKRKTPAFNPDRKYLNQAILEYLINGGEIKYLPPAPDPEFQHNGMRFYHREVFAVEM